MAVRYTKEQEMIEPSIRSTELNSSAHTDLLTNNNPNEHITKEPDQRNTLKRKDKEEEEEEKKEVQRRNLLLVIKWIALCFVASCALAGTVVNKVTLVSITGRMYSLSNVSSNDTRGLTDERNGSILFIQLVVLMVVPEVVSFFRCFIWGVIGKTTERFPWPSRTAIGWGLATAALEVIVLCGFVFGVACKLPPALTILIMNGCFCFPIGAYLMWGKVIHKNIKTYLRKKLKNTSPGGSYHRLQDQEANEEGNKADDESKKAHDNGDDTKTKPTHTVIITTIPEVLGFLMQLGLLVAIPILLVQEFKESRVYKHMHLTVIILLPISLFFLSFVWSGWTVMQKEVKTIGGKTKYGGDRLKAGLITSAWRILLIPFVSYGFARLVLDFEVSFHSSNFAWRDVELGTFLTHIVVSFFAYVFAWIASAFQYWTFLVPMLLSTPISFGWHVGSVRIDGAFVFPDEYLVDWNIKWFVLFVASFFWISQYLAFIYHIFGNSDNVLTCDEDLFWMPRYNSVFFEQHLVLNRKTAITGYSGQRIDSTDTRSISSNCHIFICSTMYHENEVEMQQLLNSIYKIAEAIEKQNNRNNKYESHIFFDGACTGEQLNSWAMQLLSLLKKTLDIEPHAHVTKLFTPYGIQLKYTINTNKGLGFMPFYIHLKDNNKVKNKKRWSQVMYMNYVLDFRTKKDKDNTFILTTDADIDFDSDSVLALLDILACDNAVGAVCARTYPLGSGPVVWYQIFDYTVGHWFQKAAEHILGCVLCCPGCFSVFRGSALKKVLETYGSSVENGFDFLTKDMGEDRWLCTLLIKAGWRLEYSAVSKNSTYCPETFEEFYKQRRRWIPSTMANLSEVISGYNEITSNNDSINILFILYEFLLLFSTLISPATVILIIVTGLTAIDHRFSEVVLIVVFSVIAVLYGVLCVYATEKTQIDAAKILTFVFAVIMAVVISGILTDTINAAIEDNPLDHTNRTSNHFRFPVDISAVYLAIFAFTFVITGIFHLNEILGLFHFIWYLLCLPSGYLFLLIYSVSNINNRSWGTREGASPKSSKSDGWDDYFLDLWYRFLEFLNKCIGKKKSPPVEDVDCSPHQVTKHNETTYKELSQDVINWLKDMECYDSYWENFEREGYTELEFIATMQTQDLLAIGINKRGFLLKLEKEVKKLPTPELITKIPETIDEWLNNLKLDHCILLFKSEGYSRGEDVENLKGLTRKDLQTIGITRQAHLNQLLTSLKYLQYRSEGEIRIIETRALMDKTEKVYLSETPGEYEMEYDFWTKLAKEKLQPESANLSKVEELKGKLNVLRNFSLLVLLLTNIMWLVFLYTLVFPQLRTYNLPDRAFSLLFLAVFSIIIVIQFIAMIFHRFGTLLHRLAKIPLRSTESTSQLVAKDFEVVSGDPPQN